MGEHSCHPILQMSEEQERNQGAIIAFCCEWHVLYNIFALSRHLYNHCELLCHKFFVSLLYAFALQNKEMQPTKCNNFMQKKKGANFLPFQPFVFSLNCRLNFFCFLGCFIYWCFKDWLSNATAWCYHGCILLNVITAYYILQCFYLALVDLWQVTAQQVVKKSHNFTVVFMSLVRGDWLNHSGFCLWWEVIGWTIVVSVFGERWLVEPQWCLSLVRGDWLNHSGVCLWWEVIGWTIVVSVFGEMDRSLQLNQKWCRILI